MENNYTKILNDYMASYANDKNIIQFLEYDPIPNYIHQIYKENNNSLISLLDSKFIIYRYKNINYFKQFRNNGNAIIQEYLPKVNEKKYMITINNPKFYVLCISNENSEITDETYLQYINSSFNYKRDIVSVHLYIHIFQEYHDIITKFIICNNNIINKIATNNIISKTKTNSKTKKNSKIKTKKNSETNNDIDPAIDNKSFINVDNKSLINVNDNIINRFLKMVVEENILELSFYSLATEIYDFNKILSNIYALLLSMLNKYIDLINFDNIKFNYIQDIIEFYIHTTTSFYRSPLIIDNKNILDCLNCLILKLDDNKLNIIIDKLLNSKRLVFNNDYTLIVNLISQLSKLDNKNKDTIIDILSNPKNIKYTNVKHINAYLPNYYNEDLTIEKNVVINYFTFLNENEFLLDYKYLNEFYYNLSFEKVVDAVGNIMYNDKLKFKNDVEYSDIYLKIILNNYKCVRNIDIFNKLHQFLCINKIQLNENEKFYIMLSSDYQYHPIIYNKLKISNILSLIFKHKKLLESLELLKSILNYKQIFHIFILDDGPFSNNNIMDSFISYFKSFSDKFINEILSYKKNKYKFTESYGRNSKNNRFHNINYYILYNQANLINRNNDKYINAISFISEFKHYNTLDKYKQDSIVINPNKVNNLSDEEIKIILDNEINLFSQDIIY